MKSEPTYLYKRMRRFRVRFGDLAACSPYLSWAGYTISMFEFEFPTRTTHPGMWATRPGLTFNAIGLDRDEPC
jgi:hypothetical protein